MTATAPAVATTRAGAAALAFERITCAFAGKTPGERYTAVSDTSLSVRTNSNESTFHLRIGATRPVEVVRVADHFFIEVDQAGDVAGFWLTGVPPFPAFDDE